MTIANFYEATCGVCRRRVISAVAPPHLGYVAFAVAPPDESRVSMCLDCGTELIKWLTERREDR